ncbi:hypothetical protein ACJW30_05G116400 [Castanea mollissima]
MSIFNSLKAYAYGGILKTKDKKQQVEKKKKKKEEDHIMKNRRKRRNNGTNEKRTIPFSWPSHGDSSKPTQIKNPLSQNAAWRKGARPITDCEEKTKLPIFNHSHPY